uniref:Uncharacterized protein n=1 Tax=mine drainage metagenome TaxID=410659 RepID=E6PJC8_9ZZZZ
MRAKVTGGLPLFRYLVDFSPEHCDAQGFIMTHV